MSRSPLSLATAIIVEQTCFVITRLVSFIVLLPQRKIKHILEDLLSQLKYKSPSMIPFPLDNLPNLKTSFSPKMQTYYNSFFPIYIYGKYSQYSHILSLFLLFFSRSMTIPNKLYFIIVISTVIEQSSQLSF